MRSSFQLPIDIQSMHLTQGSREDLAAMPPEQVNTYVWFVAPIPVAGFDPLTCQVETTLGSTTVKFFRVESEQDDVIFQSSKNFVVVADEKGKPFVPTRNLTDNRGQYPCVAVEVRFPKRLDGDTSRLPGQPFTEQERERLDLLGPDPMPEKLAALMATNRAIREHRVNGAKTISASEVTALITAHRINDSRRVLAQTVSLVTTPDAFKNAAEDYFLGAAKESVSLALASLKRAHPAPPTTEDELQSLVLSTVDAVLVHHVETRRLIEPFWDGSRRINVDGKEIEVPRSPKGETEIQPTLHVFFQMALEPFGVHVIRESDEGSGSLDFRFSTTNSRSELISVAAEFKLAHHKEVKAGIKRQLPRYMDSIPCTHGVFVLMWFKDEKGKYFSEPKSQSLQETRSFVGSLAANPENANHKIASRVIDCSIRPSASNLR
ncbi:hypothetical protein H3H37_20785 [Duganella sp. LX20W]|uniref:Uncharacterized protein n=1 Tax=Rugamonas brunnea TaxID=2758569 RepID=A0A7W2EVQ4_9BURK|nr:hypothetical protein [Rugamonas brunnea]MBA5639502.1 hypothetical protein [Rugamonas brunnea]